MQSFSNWFKNLYISSRRIVVNDFIYNWFVMIKSLHDVKQKLQQIKQFYKNFVSG